MYFVKPNSPSLLSIFSSLFLFLTIAPGCLSPEKAIRDADAIGNEIVTSFMTDITGHTNNFTISRPSDRLRNRLLAEQGLDPNFKAAFQSSPETPPHTQRLPDPLIISLADAMIIGAANDDSFQSQKESVFAQALSLDASRHDFETTFTGLFSGGYSGSENGDSEENHSRSSLSSNAKPSLSKKFKNGLSFASSLGLNVARLLTGERTTSLGLTADASLTIPLLRGAGSAIATESLTQAERNMMYAIYQFEQYRKEYAVSVADAYYNMLEKQQNQMATRDNAARLSENFKRAKMQYDAGRLSQVELDQTRQDLLSNQDALTSSELALKTTLDAFKKSLGLPIDARIELDMNELDRVRDSMMSRVTETNSAGQPIQPKHPWSLDEAIQIAFTNRIEVILARYKLEDSRRQFKLASNELLPELALSLSANHGRDKSSASPWSDSSSYGANLSFSPLWDHTAKRNAYRNAAIALDAAERSWIMLQDTTRQLIRDDYRALDSAWSSYVIQCEALSVAERRVRSTSIFQQAGKSSTRDVLDAQNALVTAQNSVVNALVKYRMAGLKLRLDLSKLVISEDGLLLED